MGAKFAFTESVLINRPVEQVYQYACDYRNDIYWRKGVIEMRAEPPGIACDGMRTFEVLRSYGRSVTTEAEIREVIPNRRAAFKALTGPIKVSGYRALSPEDGGTRVELNLTGELDAFFSILWPFMRGGFARQMKEDLLRLKQRIEMSQF
jgi:uncharacterized membrane protein